MPCEGCNVQFTVFKRKRNCTECRRFYCNQCLVKRNSSITLCEKCVIFTKRPLLKIDLLKLKPKDLIFYLQSKHISTTGCVEKEELVTLILTHVNSSDNKNNSCGSQSPHSQSSNNFKKSNSSNSFNSGMGSNDNTNPFDQLKQTCQSFFSNFTEKIATDLNLINESSKPTTPTSTTTSGSNISDQPRVAKREIPSYASQNNHHPSQRHFRYSEVPTQRNGHRNPTHGNNLTSSVPNEHLYPSNANSCEGSSCGGSSKPNTASTTPSSPSSPINSFNSISSQSVSLQQPQERNDTEQAQSNNRKPINKKILTPDNNKTDEIATVHKCTSNNHRIFKNVLSNSSGADSSIAGTGENSGCDCSDDEIITKFRIRQQKNKGKLQKSFESSTSPQTDNHVTPIPSTSGNNEVEELNKNESTGGNNELEELTKNCRVEESSTSSFEELGAVGGSNSGLEAGAGNNSSDNEHWLVVNNESNDDIHQQNKKEMPEIEVTTSLSSDNKKNIPFKHSPVTTLAVFDDGGLGSLPSSFNHLALQRQRRIIRRRSDGFIYNQNRVNAAAAAIDMINVHPDTSISFPIASSSTAGITNNMPRVDEESDDESEEQVSITRKRVRKSCTRCGKSKRNLKRHVIKFKKQLESTLMSEDDIKKELEAFLQYLENRAKSFESCSDDSNDEGSFHGFDLNTLGSRLTEQYYEAAAAAAAAFLGENEGIHVYAHNENEGHLINNGRYDNRFLNLNDFQTSEEIDELTVKQLKEILMLNRVDYKGCCEKQELLDRVHRLWKEFQESPAVEKLQTDDLCKICMDAPIECVILECGHLATCTNCGKVLNECPICRQYIVRVVRFFRA